MWCAAWGDGHFGTGELSSQSIHPHARQYIQDRGHLYWFAPGHPARIEVTYIGLLQDRDHLLVCSKHFLLLKSNLLLAHIAALEPVEDQCEFVSCAYIVSMALTSHSSWTTIVQGYSSYI